MELKTYNPVVLLIMDGFGIPKDQSVSAITKKNTKTLQALGKKYGYSTLNASGEAVGLPSTQTGTSDIGHLTIGTGRVNFQPLVRINKAISSGEFFKNAALLKACENANKNNKALHIFGMLSTGGVHGHISHIYSLLQLAKEQKVKNVYLHMFTDGRDTPPKSAKKFEAQLAKKIAEIGVGKVATIGGRFYGLDRDNNYDRNQVAYDAMVNAKGQTALSAKEAIEAAYSRGETDEFMLPTVILENGKPVATIKKGDSVIFANYRADRERQLTRVFVEKNDLPFVKNLGLTFVTMTNYDNTFKKPIVAFDEIKIENTLSEIVSRANLPQAKIAETEKYAYVTFAFNAGKQDAYAGEDRFLVPSAKVKSFDLKPEMSAREITDIAEEKILSGTYALVTINLANGDMVGHSGNKQAATTAIGVVDECVKRITDATLKVGGSLLITADHGNADIMQQKDGSPHTAHTMAKVPTILVSKNHMPLKKTGTLADIAPTILQLLKLPQPQEMTGKSLIK